MSCEKVSALLGKCHLTFPHPIQDRDPEKHPNQHAQQYTAYIANHMISRSVLKLGSQRPTCIANASSLYVKGYALCVSIYSTHSTASFSYSVVRTTLLVFRATLVTLVKTTQPTIIKKPLVLAMF